MQLGHLLTRSGLTYPEVSSKVYHDSFCHLYSSVSLPWVIYFEAFYLHVVSSFSCMPVIFPKLVLFLAPLQFAHLFCRNCNGVKNNTNFGQIQFIEPASSLPHLKQPATCPYPEPAPSIPYDHIPLLENPP